MAESTKERIISAAFSFYGRPRFTNLSLSQIAQKVGISKAAIFKHFSGKDELIRAMEDKLYADVMAELGRMYALAAEGRGGEALPAIMDFLAAHREYLFYLCCTKLNFSVDTVAADLRRRGAPFFDRIYAEDGTVKDLELYFVSVFVSSSLFLFMAVRFWLEEERGVSFAAPGVFARKVDALLEAGLDGEGAVITPLRMAEIDAVCKECVAGVPPISRELSAFAAVVQEFGMQGMTVEKIAAELGLAKSTLYSRYTDKLQMVSHLLHQEMELLRTLIIQAAGQYASCGERLYALFQLEIEYFIARPPVIDVMNALFISGSILRQDAAQDVPDEQPSIDGLLGLHFFDTVPDVGMGDDTERTILCWLQTLPLCTYLHCRGNHFSEAIMRGALKNMYYMVEIGIQRSGGGWLPQSATPGGKQ